MTQNSVDVNNALSGQADKSEPNTQTKADPVLSVKQRHQI